MSKNVSVVIILVFWLGVFFFLKLSNQESQEDQINVNKKEVSQEDMKTTSATSKDIIKEE